MKIADEYSYLMKKFKKDDSSNFMIKTCGKIRK